MDWLRSSALAFAFVACSGSNRPQPASTDGTNGTGVQTGPGTLVDYPPGPYGLAVGDVFPPIEVAGYVGSTPPWTAIRAKDYFDPTGSRGINGLYVTVSAPWCSGCQLEGRTLPGLYRTQYRARGARILTLLLQDSMHEPASQSTAEAWVTTFGTPYDVGTGNASAVIPPDNGSGAASLPYNYAIDPRTMKIAHVDSGDYFRGDALPSLDAVLGANGAP